MHALSIFASGSDGGGGAGSLVSFGILLLIPLAMYFLMIRPQRRKMRDQQAMQASLDVGDEVMTASGVYGFITGFDGDVAWLEIDDDVQIRVNRSFLSGKVDTSASAAASASASDADAAEPATGTASTPPAPVTPTVKGVRPGRKAATSEGDTVGPDPTE
jgi:preprotein translocase subunit YajC